MDDTARETPAWLAETQAALRSHDHTVRADALRELLNRVEKDPSAHAAALPLFRDSLESEIVPWALGYAAKGIERIVDEFEAQSMWRSLLERPDARQVSHVAIVMDKPQHVPLLLEVLQKRSEPEIRLNVVSMLGRSGNRGAVPAIIAALDDAAVRPYAISALGDLGDPAAIPAMEAYLSDKSPAWPIDNHGPMLSVGDVAREALKKLRHSKQRSPGGAPSAATTLAAGSWSAPRDTWTSVEDKRGSRFPFWCFAYVPLMAAAFEMIWIFAVFSHDPAQARIRERTQSELRVLTLVASLPVLFGAGVGVVALWRGWAARWFERLAAVIGIVGCAAFLVQLAKERANAWQ